MYPHASIKVCHRGILSLALASALSGGCALVPEDQPADSRVSDTMGQGLRGIPDDVASLPPAKKQPFWEKYRDQRVRDIDRNLGVTEPAGW